MFKTEESEHVQDAHICGTNWKDLMERLLTVPQLAAVLQVPPSWIYSRTRERGQSKIPIVYVGKYCRFRLGDVLDWLQKRESE